MNRFPSVAQSNNTSTGYPREEKPITYEHPDHYAPWGHYPGVTAIAYKTAINLQSKIKQNPEKKRKVEHDKRNKYIYRLYRNGIFIGKLTARELVNKGFFGSISMVSKTFLYSMTSKKGYSLEREETK